MKEYEKLRLDCETHARQKIDDLETKDKLEFIFKENKDEIIKKKKYPFYIIIDKIKRKIGITNFSLLDFQKDEYEKVLRKNKEVNSIADTFVSFIILVLIISLIIVSLITL